MNKKLLSIGLAAATVLLLVSMAAAQPRAGWPKSVTVGAAPVGGTYFIWAGGFTKLLNDKLQVPGNVESTGGPVHNVQLIEDQKLDFGMVTNGPSGEGWNGEGWAKGKKYQNQRAIFPMYTTYFQMYSMKKSNIRSIMDLDGKSVGVGPVGGTPATYWPIIFKVAGVKPGRIVNASSADLNSQIRDGMIDANGQSVGLPWVTITEVETTDTVNAYGVPGDVAQKFVAKYPYFATGIIPKGTYKSNPDQDLPTLTIWNFMVVHKDTPDDFVYEVVKQTFDNVDILIAAHKSAQEVKAENAVFTPVPMHPGALKYYAEKGIKIPEAMIPR
jgi:TRAP transporter TAXI family solute receptor